MADGMLEMVWADCGNRCAFCGKSWALCERLQERRTVYHVGDDEAALLIPLCDICEEVCRQAKLRVESYAIAIAEYESAIDGLGA